MSWSQFHERNTFMRTLIERAATDPNAALDFSDDEIVDVERLFGDVDGLMLALRQRWITTLTAKLDQAAHDDIPAERVRSELALANPGLRGLLDVAALRSVRLRSLERQEQTIVDYYEVPNPRRQTVA